MRCSQDSNALHTVVPLILLLLVAAALALVKVCCEEILEEVGYRVSPQQLACCAGSVISSAGVTGAPQAVFFAQVIGAWQQGSQHVQEVAVRMPEQLPCRVRCCVCV